MIVYNDTDEDMKLKVIPFKVMTGHTGMSKRLEPDSVVVKGTALWCSSYSEFTDYVSVTKEGILKDFLRELPKGNYNVVFYSELIKPKTLQEVLYGS